MSIVNERRDPVRRAAFVRAVVTEIVQSPASQFTTIDVERILQTTPEIADRILQRLATAGLLQQTRRGVWTKVRPPQQFSSRVI